ncbi:MAG: XRE family transcriptional regulator [Eubacteriales bacterium]|nr:XRE family transcriptional regulator [Eubacteriales bacterium]
MGSLIGNRIKARRIFLNLSVDELAERINKSRATIYRYENGDIESLPTTILEPLAKALETTPADLMGWDDTDVPHLAEQISLGDYQIPIVGRVAAGVPLFSADNIEGYIDYRKNPRSEVFAMHVVGQSMEPKIMDGDLIIIDKSAAWDDGDIVVVTVNGDEGTVKRIRRYADGIRLIPINQAVDPMDFTKEEVLELPIKVVGKVVQLRRDI